MQFTVLLCEKSDFYKSVYYKFRYDTKDKFFYTKFPRIYTEKQLKNRITKGQTSYRKDGTRIRVVSILSS